LEKLQIAYCLIIVIYLAIADNEAYFGSCCPNTGHYPCGVESIKRFLNVHLHCVVSNLKMISTIRRCPFMEKFLQPPMAITYNPAVIEPGRKSILSKNGDIF